MMENANPEQELPAEILDEIFSLAITSLLTYEDAGTLLNIGLACHAWHIALSPWSTLCCSSCPQLQSLTLRFSHAACFETLMDGIQAQATSSTRPDTPLSSLRSVKHGFRECVPSQRPNTILESIFADLPHSLEILHLELGRVISRLSTTDIHVPAPPSTFLSNLKSLTINSEQDTPLFLSALRR
ncbi:hypothetical protein FA13DRAFT_1748071 [Coprinellus micaceus]|uniref:F-box domain-containing protein n=1 Tax=Coprinellus micaceus TaxID=71717 RepID=A0A4Y7RYW7_COPMI|nr:hypothetical protein FA13DRAFT_1748071 [Coprinellus micaceus]